VDSRLQKRALAPLTSHKENASMRQSFPVDIDARTRQFGRTFREGYHPIGIISYTPPEPAPSRTAETGH